MAPEILFVIVDGTHGRLDIEKPVSGERYETSNQERAVITYGQVSFPVDNQGNECSERGQHPRQETSRR